MAVQDTTKHWADQLAPDATTLQAIARQAYASLPVEFRRLTDKVPILVEEFPNQDIADDLGLDSPFDILGLFEGQGPSGHWTPTSKSKHNRITLYRRAILDYWCENPETLHDIVTHILINELGHHFGLSEVQIAQIENEVS